MISSERKTCLLEVHSRNVKIFGDLRQDIRISDTLARVIESRCVDDGYVPTGNPVSEANRKDLCGFGFEAAADGGAGLASEEVNKL